MNSEGQLLGSTDAVQLVTIGQRKGLGLGPTMYPVPYEGQQDLSLRSSGSSGAREPVAAASGPSVTCPGGPGSGVAIED